jgi:uncharacterized heparinase superfamily protein
VLQYAGDRAKRPLRLDTPHAPGWPAAFTAIDRCDPPVSCAVEELQQRTFRFVGEELQVRFIGDWRPAERSQLFRYNLHYLEWLWVLAAQQDRVAARSLFDQLWREWSNGTRFGSWDEWSPYVVALRLWVLCGVFSELAAEGPLAGELRDTIGLHAGFLRRNVEFDVGGNHLIKNLKALFGAGVFLGHEGLVRFALAHLERQMAIQVHEDGGHFERSPSYHAQVLGDLIDVVRLGEAAQIRIPARVVAAVGSMRQWLRLMQLPDGSLPPFGDCAPVTRGRLRALDAHERLPFDGVRALAASGYVILKRGRWQAVLDVGGPCPPDLPAHAQAGCLGFVLCLDGRTVASEAGTSTYVGERRRYERSTAAHSTIEIDGENQTEVWSSFRAGRLARATLHEIGDRPIDLLARASHDGYRFLPGSPRHERTWRLSEGGLRIDDRLIGSGFHMLTSRIHVTGSCDELTVTVTDPSGRPFPVGLVPTRRASGFGQLVDGFVVTATVTASLPTALTTALTDSRSLTGARTQE